MSYSEWMNLEFKPIYFKYNYLYDEKKAVTFSFYFCIVDLIIDQIMETESNNRERAVTDFMKEIQKNADMVTKFVFVLEKKGEAE